MECAGCEHRRDEFGCGGLHFADDDVEAVGGDVEGGVDVGDDEAFLDSLAETGSVAVPML